MLLLGALLLAGCSGSGQGTNVDPDQIDTVESPELGACRVLDPRGRRAAEQRHPHRRLRRGAHGRRRSPWASCPTSSTTPRTTTRSSARFAYRECSTRFEKFLGADESLAMRTVVSWAWFRPSEEAWDQGARWYRCDIVGGGDQSTDYVALPEDAKGLLQGRIDDRWLVCADGPTVAAAARVPCSEAHSWRAVTTIKLGEPEDDYPGDRLVEVQTRDFCDKSVGAVLGYPRRVRLRLHLVPRGGVGGRQPPVDLLGQDGPMSIPARLSLIAAIAVTVAAVVVGWRTYDRQPGAEPGPGQTPSSSDTPSASPSDGHPDAGRAAARAARGRVPPAHVRRRGGARRRRCGTSRAASRTPRSPSPSASWTRWCPATWSPSTPNASATRSPAPAPTASTATWAAPWSSAG